MIQKEWEDIDSRFGMILTRTRWTDSWQIYNENSQLIRRLTWPCRSTFHSRPYQLQCSDLDQGSQWPHRCSFDAVGTKRELLQQHRHVIYTFCMPQVALLELYLKTKKKGGGEGKPNASCILIHLGTRNVHMAAAYRVYFILHS